MARLPQSPVKDDLPVLAFTSQRAWETWLAKHHESSKGLWLKLARKDSGIDSVSYPDALDVALCYGWIDGQRAALDDRFYLQRFTSRTPRSKWSKINCGKVNELIAAGRMTPAGLRQVERAKADGRWDAAYDGQRTATVPEDLRQALAKNKEAQEAFAALDSRNRYAILYRIQDARRPETRARRVERFVEMLKQGKRPY